MVKLHTKDNSKSLKDGLKNLKKFRVLVGVPEQNASRAGETINNAELAYTMSHGSPLKNIPARPIIEPVLEKNKDQITKMFKAAGEKALDNKDIKNEYEKIGMFAKNAVIKNFTDPDNGWSPNSPVTIRKKGSDMPLIDTGSLRKSIDYVVEEV